MKLSTGEEALRAVRVNSTKANIISREIDDEPLLDAEMKSSPIQGRLGECEYALTQLCSAVHRLANRIDLVLCPDQPRESAKANMPQPPQSGLYIQLDSHQMSLRQLTGFVEDIMERCEL